MNIAQYHTVPYDAEPLQPEFSDLYIDVRRREKRLFTDGEVMFLPDINPLHIHYKEWLIRKHSSQTLIAYLSNKNRRLKILEIGCGNGWLSSKLSSINGTTVIGLDINEVEIRQARRVFKNDNLQFVCNHFDPEVMKVFNFDIILFAASIQYFPTLQGILKSALACLNQTGEVHIIDTPIYKAKETAGAKLRGKNYFSSLDCPEMASHCFYHSFDELQQFNYKILANPGNVLNRISKMRPFYWLTVTH